MLGIVSGLLTTACRSIHDNLIQTQSKKECVSMPRKSNGPFREILVRKFSRFTRKREHVAAF